MAIIEDSISAAAGFTAAIDREALLDTSWNEQLGSAVTIAYGTDISVAWIDTLGVAVVLTPERAVDGSVTAALGLSAVMSLVTEIGVTMMTSVQAGFSVPVFDSAGSVWVVSPEGRTTRYEGFDYTGFAKIGPHQYGVKADGVYRLEGDTDAGLPIQAAIGLGKQGFGTSLQKSLVACYLGVSSTSRMYLKVIANGKEFLYAARQDSETMKAQRVDPGKGIKATLLDFVLYNSDGADFDLSSVEFTAIPLGRRI